MILGVKMELVNDVVGNVKGIKHTKRTQENVDHHSLTTSVDR